MTAEDKLKIAVEALERYADRSKWYQSEVSRGFDECVKDVVGGSAPHFKDVFKLGGNGYDIATEALTAIGNDAGEWVNMKYGGLPKEDGHYWWLTESGEKIYTDYRVGYFIHPVGLICVAWWSEPITQPTPPPEYVEEKI